MKRFTFLGLVVCLLATGCNGSKNPLSDPCTAKPDNRLLGVWRECTENGEVTDCHVGHAGEKLPESVMRVVVTHRKGKAGPIDKFMCLAFATVLGGKTYLNVVPDWDQKLFKLLDAKGWQADAVNGYIFFKYQVDGDKLVVWRIDEHAQQRAISSGKVKGVATWSVVTFTNTTENVARFVAQAGDRLFDTKEPGRLERAAGVDRQRGSGLLFPEQVERAMMIAERRAR